MAILFEKKVKDFIESFADETMVTVFDAQIGLTLASLEAGKLKEKGIFDDYGVKSFCQYDKNVVLLGVMKNENAEIKRIS